MFHIQGPVKAVPVWVKEEKFAKACPNPHYKEPAELLPLWAQWHLLHFVEALQDNSPEAAGGCPLSRSSWSGLAVIRAALPDLIHVTQACRRPCSKSRDHFLVHTSSCPTDAPSVTMSSSSRASSSCCALNTLTASVVTHSIFSKCPREHYGSHIKAL